MVKMVVTVVTQIRPLCRHFEWAPLGYWTPCFICLVFFFFWTQIANQNEYKFNEPDGVRTQSSPMLITSLSFTDWPLMTNLKFSIPPIYDRTADDERYLNISLSVVFPSLYCRWIWSCVYQSHYHQSTFMEEMKPKITRLFCARRLAWTLSTVYCCCCCWLDFFSSFFVFYSMLRHAIVCRRCGSIETHWIGSFCRRIGFVWLRIANEFDEFASLCGMLVERGELLEGMLSAWSSVDREDWSFRIHWIPLVRMQ